MIDLHAQILLLIFRLNTEIKKLFVLNKKMIEIANCVFAQNLKIKNMYWYINNL